MLFVFVCPEDESSAFCRNVGIRIHGVTLQNTVFYTSNAVPASNVAYWSKISSFPMAII